MRLTLFFPVTLPPMRNVADDSLATVIDRHMLHRNLLLAARAVFLQGFDLGSEGAGQLVEGAFGAILLRDILDMREATGERHSRQVHRRHL